jgi:ERCC4-related helicase
MGIPELDTAHLEGSVQSDKRGSIWNSKRVFFCTPQTLLNDITSGRCDPLQIVCLVVDEAHKATANYAYTSAVKLIGEVSTHFRVLALSATPGSDIKKIQNVRY